MPSHMWKWNEQKWKSNARPVY